jgi:hypothetical protein
MCGGVRVVLTRRFAAYSDDVRRAAETVVRMLAALAVLLAIGATAAVIAPELTALAIAVVTGLTFVLAVVIAGVLIAPVVVAGALRRGRVRSPPTWWLAIALVAGAAIVFPVHDRYYPEREWAAVGSQVGLCDGVLPLSEFVQNRLADDRYARWYYVGGCND